MPRHRDQQDAAVEGHDRQHQEVGEADAEAIRGRLDQADDDPFPRRGAGGGGDASRQLEVPAVGGPLDEDGEEEAEEEGDDVQAGASGGPPGEEDLRVRPPEEGHVRVALLVSRHPVHFSNLPMLCYACTHTTRGRRRRTKVKKRAVRDCVLEFETYMYVYMCDKGERARKTMRRDQTPNGKYNDVLCRTYSFLMLRSSTHIVCTAHA